MVYPDTTHFTALLVASPPECVRPPDAEARTLRPEPRAEGTSILVAPGIRWIRMPRAFALNHINLWLLDDERGTTVVDTGVGLPSTRALWETLLAGELRDRPVVRVVVTHFHPDHIGNAEWLAARFGVEVWCPQAEWLMCQLAWQGMGGNDSERRLGHYRRHGVPEAQVEAFRERGNHYRQLVPSVIREFRAVREDDDLAIGGRRWHAFTVLGHAPEHACLVCPEANVLISGDCGIGSRGGQRLRRRITSWRRGLRRRQPLPQEPRVGYGPRHRRG